jgi:hypothetical protein
MTKKKQRRKCLSNRKTIKQKKTKVKLDNLNQENQLNNEHLQSILAKKPLEKNLSVQFYPVEHVQFISNRFGNK